MIRLRTVRPADAPVVLALTDRLADFELPPGRTAREVALADHPILRAQLDAPREDVLFLVAEDETGAVAGTVFANTARDYFTQRPIAYVEVLAVAESAAGRGVARSLMEAVESWARERGLARVDLTGFYEHLGYHEEFVRYVKPL